MNIFTKTQKISENVTCFVAKVEIQWLVDNTTLIKFNNDLCIARARQSLKNRGLSFGEFRLYGPHKGDFYMLPDVKKRRLVY